MRFTSKHLTLWYGTDDAPAPVDGVAQSRSGVVVNVAAQPVSPSNTVLIHFRVDGGCTQALRAVRVLCDLSRNVEYHRAVFPDLTVGEWV